MKLCIPCSWDSDLVEGLKKINDGTKNIHELYGSAQISIVGSGRPSGKLPEVSFAQIKEHIEFIHSSGFSFNYLLNAACLGGKEFEKKSAKEISDYLDQIAGLGADTVTVSNPYLIELIRKEYPSLKVKAGLFADVNSVNTAMHFDELGVDRITLGWNLNRNFNELKKIRRNVKAGLEVIVNLGCIYDCPMRYYHSRLTGHEAQKREDGQPPILVNYPPLKCAQKRIDSTEELIKSPWIRPEDAGIYDDLGIEFFKIAGRTLPTGWILRCAGAYSEGRHDGNLLDLMEAASIRLLSPFTGDKTPVSSVYHIDNQSLAGFIDFFKEHECVGDCEVCGYCPDVTKKAVKITGDVEKYKAGLKDVLGNVVSKGFTETDIYHRLCP
ncbi:MAG: peptidase U32 family protein [bacterium]